MQGIQVHIESHLASVRLVGMVVGEHLMKSLKPDVKEQLKFEYKDTEQTLWLKKLMEPIEEQVRHACHKPLPNLCFPSSKPYTPPIHCLTLSLPCSLTCLHRIRVFMGRHRREGTRSLSKPACLMVLIQM